jgi:catechol 2,3-dioxygenase-like lactoylglutathione lyase family enzyme
MLTRLWTIGVKVPDLEKELEFHRQIGNSLVLDETLEVNGQRFRVPLIRMGDKYMHLAEKMVYESLLDQVLPCGITHLVYRSDSFDEDVRMALDAGSTLIGDIANISAGFGDRRVAFFRAPGGWIFEIIQVLKDRVPEV